MDKNKITKTLWRVKPKRQVESSDQSLSKCLTNEETDKKGSEDSGRRSQ